ncbi:MAG: hypothetical protein KJ734_09985, partial [Chloroflexi bacterium]|nr:hypothetical protein [Chloroflexota bacterium]
AIAAAVNDLIRTADGYRLTHPQHTAAFTPAGVEFAPRNGGPSWAWQLTDIAAADAPLAGVATGPVNPIRETSLTVSYPRGGLVEQYVARQAAVEQQFVIPGPLALAGADLVIAGAIQCPGEFEETATGWRWRSDDGAVRLGHVRVYDAAGRELPATMQATATQTRITVDGTALAQAAYPVLIDPEIGNDFRLSSMGPDNDSGYSALAPAVAYNSQDNQNLVVWYGNDTTLEFEIWGQRVNAATGAQIGADLRISYMGPAGDTAYGGYYPDVAYNSANNEYLVVWSGDHYADGDQEIWGRRVNPATGGLLGSMVRISVMGTTADYDGYNPAVAYNSTDNQYLVVWNGDDDGSGLVDGEYEIWGKRLTAMAEWVDADEFRISDMGPGGDVNYDAQYPDVAYNSTNNEYMVVWEGDDQAYDRADNELEIWGQRLNASGGAMGANDFRISTMGPNTDPDYDANDPAIAYNSANNEYLVVWSGDDVVNGQFDVFGQRLQYNGVQLGLDDFYVSNPGVGPNGNYDALNPAVAYDRANNEYLVVWADDELGVGEFEIWGQRVDAATGNSVGTDTRLSDMGPDGDANRDAQTPAAAYSRVNNNQYLVVWSGEDGVDGEFEIWAQRFTGGCKLHLPLVLRNH